MRPIAFDLRLRATAHLCLPAEGVGPLPCPACGARLELHQPDPDADRLLATCPCEDGGAWYIPVPAPGGGAARLVRFPAVAELAEAIARAAGD